MALFSSLLPGVAAMALPGHILNVDVGREYTSAGAVVLDRKTPDDMLFAVALLDRAAKIHDHDLVGDVAHQQAIEPRPERPGAVDELLLLERQDAAADGARVGHPVGQPEHQDEVQDRVAQDRDRGVVVGPQPRRRRERMEKEERETTEGLDLLVR